MREEEGTALNPYTHYWMASRLEPTFQPDQPGGYYLGAIIPDVRYLARVPRQQTHISQAQIREFRSRFPDLSSFLMGYQAHCLLDEIDLTRVVGAAFPLRWVSRLTRRKFSQQQLTVMAELYFLQQKGLGWRISENHNLILSELGIQPEQTKQFLAALQRYLPDPSPASGLEAFQQIGYVESTRFEKYFSAYQSLERSRLLKAILLWSVKNARLEEFSVQYVQRRLREEQGRVVST